MEPLQQPESQALPQSETNNSNSMPQFQSDNIVRHHDPSSFERKPPGPQLWAVVLSLVGLYYLWTRILGRPLPSFLQRRSGQRIGTKGKSSGSVSEIQAARERQQQRLQTANRAKEMVQQAKDRNIRERNNATTTTSPADTSLLLKQQQEELFKNQLQQQQKKELEEKKKKQRQLYLRQKALQEKEEETRRKDEELGPGWRYREDPDGAVNGNAVNSMDPQAGGDGGGYKPKTHCTRRGG